MASISNMQGKPYIGKPHITRGLPFPIRREMRDLQKNYPDQWNLYLLALADFQATPEDEQLSYYQIAGIHARPYNSWDGAEGFKDRGYCTHSSILFPTWHRPYLALFEQVLHTHVLSQAKEFLRQDGEARYLQAAQDFRMPYWDWTLEPMNGDKNHLPAAIENEDIDVVKPGSKGKRESMKNPLHNYHFKKLEPWVADTTVSKTADETTANATAVDEPTVGEKMIDEKTRLVNSAIVSGLTVRYPKLISQHNLLNDALKNEVANLREKVFLLVASYKKYEAFSHDNWDTKDAHAKYNSLEGIHNNIHGIIGGDGGHMNGVPYAAFDPAFWLHHTNVDRLFAIWQALHPDDGTGNRYVKPQKNKEGTFITEPNGEETIKTPLAPFRRTMEEYWTSEDVRQTSIFGYAYPETQAWNFRTEKEYRAAIVKALQDPYPPLSLALVLAGDAQSQKTAVAKILETSTYKRANEISKSKDIPEISKLAPDNKYLEWAINVRAQKHSSRATFNVHFFLGDFAEKESKEWPFDANRVGRFTALGDSDSTGCKKCKKDQADNLQVTGQIPLTMALVERFLAGEFLNLSDKEIVPYLQKHLHWRVTKSNGVEKPRRKVKDLVVCVTSNEVTVPASTEELPQYDAKVTVYPEITTKKASEKGGRGEGTGLTKSGLTHEQGGNV